MQDYSNAIVVKMTGGIGNQLFGFAAGLSQAKRLGCRLVLDARAFGSTEIRTFELAQLGYEVIQPKPSQDKLASKLAFLAKSKPTDDLVVFKESGFDFDDSINQVKPGTLLTGYFQSWKYFTNVEEELLKILGGPLQIEHKAKTNKSSIQEGTMHVRRGDYLDEKTMKFHGLATNSYFNRSLRFLATTMNQVKVNIYSDSPDLIDLREYKTDFYLSLVDDSSLSAIETLDAMSRSEGFIMSNSSFSWWAAWLMGVRGGKGPVIAPRPWFASGLSAHDLLKPDWITLDAR